MTDANNKEETFESYINKIIENPNLQKEFLMSCVKELKQLHDKEIKNINYNNRNIINKIRERDKEIEKLTDILNKRREYIGNSAAEFIKMEFDIQEKDKQISELKDLLSKKYGIMAKDKGVEGLLNQITELQVELQKHNDQYNKEIQGLKAEIEHEKETSCLAIMQVEEDKKKLKNKISLNKLEIERLNATLTLLRTDNEKLKKDLEEYY